MTKHPYVRAYMAGAMVPTLALLGIISAFIVVRLLMQFPHPIERGIIFPMAFVPNLFGLWNVLYLRFVRNLNIPLGVHGAILPIVMAPLGVLVAQCLGMLRVGSSGFTYFETIVLPYTLLIPAFLCALAVYYLIWKYLVGFFNRVVDIA
jgi:hypothetical protein